MFDPIAVGRVVANLSQLHDMEKGERQLLQKYVSRLEVLMTDLVGELNQKDDVPKSQRDLQPVSRSKVDEEWKTYFIPSRAFGTQGFFVRARKHSWLPGKVEWIGPRGWAYGDVVSFNNKAVRCDNRNGVVIPRDSEGKDEG